MAGTYIRWSMDDLSNAILQMQARKFDCIIVFDGARGLGKSTGAIRLARKLGGFKMTRDIVFSREEVIRHLATRKNSIILADEMINVTYNRDFYMDEQKKILKMLNMYRDSCNVFICCVPNFADLDPQFRALTKIRVSVVERGMAIIHTQNHSKYSKDPWDMKINESIEKIWVRSRSKKPKYHKYTTFKGVITYGQLGAKQQRLYDKLKAEKRNIIVMTDIKKGEFKHEPFYNLLINHKVTREMAEQYCLMNDVKYSLLNSQINARLRENNVKATMLRLFIKPFKEKYLEEKRKEDVDNIVLLKNQKIILPT